MQYQYRDRKAKKREARKLWIQQINAATRQHGVSLIATSLAPQNPCYDAQASVPDRGPSPHTHFFFHLSQVIYSQFMHTLAKDNIKLDRKTLSDLAINEPHSFKALVDRVKFMRGPNGIE